MFTKIVLACALIVACNARHAHRRSRHSHYIVHQEQHQEEPQYEEEQHEEHHEKIIDEHAYPKYMFKYGVEDPHSGVYNSHQEMRDGDVVRGEYSLLQPDGSYRTVTYFADPHTGFHAHVHNTPPVLNEH